jgi:hypothetical protein
LPEALIDREPKVLANQGEIDILPVRLDQRIEVDSSFFMIR